MTRVTRMPYAAVRSRLRTGDLLLCSGETVFSRVVRAGSKSRWSHVGMIIVASDGSRPLVWESTTPTKSPDVEVGKPVDGVQMVALEHRLATYPGAVSIRHLKTERTESMLQALREFQLEVKGRGFDKNPLELFKAAVDDAWWLDENQTDLTRLFCSELVAETYKRMGLLPEQPASNEYLPRDFSSDEHAMLPLIGGAALSGEIEIIID